MRILYISILAMRKLRAVLFAYAGIFYMRIRSFLGSCIY